VKPKAADYCEDAISGDRKQAIDSHVTGKFLTFFIVVISIRVCV